MMNKRLIILLLLGATVFGGILRFYNLNWDGQFALHPDERNIASAVTQLNFAGGDFAPNFFAYGSLPIYVIRLVVEIAQSLDIPILGTEDSFSQAILTSRFLSALLSTILIPMTYLVVKNLGRSARKNYRLPITDYGLLAAILIAATPGLIQFAHFGTFESWLAFEYLLILYFALRIVENSSWYDYLGLSMSLAMALATKIVSLVLLPILPLAWLLSNLRHSGTKAPAEVVESYGGAITLLQHTDSIPGWSAAFRVQNDVKKLLTALILILTFTFLFAPYQILDWKGFMGSMNYEGPVARGSLDVFYTQQFTDTTPVIYQLTKVFPYILGLPLIILSVLGLIYFGYQIISELWHSFVNWDLRFENWPILLLLSIIGLYLLPLLTFFVKWTRYMMPVLPLLIILSILFLHKLYELARRSWHWLVTIARVNQYEKAPRPWVYLVTNMVIVIVVGWTVLQGVNFFSIYLQTDSRVQAAEWAEKNIPADAKILSEVYDLGILPFNSKFPVSKITLYNTYNLDNPNATESTEELYRLSKNSDYIVLPGQRVWVTRQRLCDKYPHGCRFYRELFSGSLGYQQVAEFQRKPLFRLPFVYAYPDYGLPIADYHLYPDETFYIFDNPSVLIFKNTQKL